MIAPDQDLSFPGNSTTTVTVSGTFPTGALILVAVGFGTATSGQSISQSGNSFTNIVTRENSATNNLVYWIGYIANWAGGALSTTFTLSGAGKDAGARLLSFTGVKASSPLLLSHDAGGAPSSTTFDTGAASGTVLGNSLLVGFFTFANSASLVAPITTGGTPAVGWNRTAVTDGSSANTPHGHASLTWQILPSGNTGLVVNPDATLVSGSARSYSATIAAFAEEQAPFLDPSAQVLQWASWWSKAAPAYPQFVDPKVSEVLGFAKLGTSGTQISGTVTVSMGLSATTEAGGSLVGASASVLSIAELGQSQVYGAVTASMGLSVQDEAGGSFVAASLLQKPLFNQIAGTIVPVYGAVTASMGLSVADEAASSLTASASGLMQRALAGTIVPVYGTVTASMGLSVQDEAASGFVAASSGLLQRAIAGTIVPVYGAVTASLGVSVSSEAGGPFVSSAAGVTAIAQKTTAPSSLVSGTVTASLGLSTQAEAGGSLVGPAVQLRGFAILAGQTLRSGAVTASMGLSAVEEAGGMFVAPSAGVLTTAMHSIAIQRSQLVSPQATVVDAQKPAGSIAQGGLIGNAAGGLAPSGTIVATTTPGASVGTTTPTGTVVNT